MEQKIKKKKVIISKSHTTKLPEYQTKGSAGCDVRADINLPVWIHPGEMRTIPTGLRIKIPEGYEIQIRSRSGLAFKKMIVILNSPGTIDDDYRDEIKILLINYGKEPYQVTKGEKIGQFVMNKVEKIQWDEITEQQFNEIVKVEKEQGINRLQSPQRLFFAGIFCFYQS